MEVPMLEQISTRNSVLLGVSYKAALKGVQILDRTRISPSLHEVDICMIMQLNMHKNENAHQYKKKNNKDYKD